MSIGVDSGVIFLYGSRPVAVQPCIVSDSSRSTRVHKLCTCIICWTSSDYCCTFVWGCTLQAHTHPYPIPNIVLQSELCILFATSHLLTNLATAVCPELPVHFAIMRAVYCCCFILKKRHNRFCLPFCSHLRHVSRPLHKDCLLRCLASVIIESSAMWQFEIQQLRSNYAT